MNKYFKILIPVLFCIVCCAVPLGIMVMTSHAKNAPEIAYAPEENEIILPEILYISGKEAVSQLTALGLRVIETEKIHHPVIPEGYVLTQSPSAGAVMQKGDTVTLSLSDGWTEYVPDLRDMPKEKASERLETLGFSAEYQEKSSETVAPGAVITQSIPADTRTALGSTVLLTISTGREQTDTSVSETVGNYVGMDFEEARTQLSELYLYALQADTVYDPDIPNGTIISQDIPPGTSVPQGTSIQMKVSLGQITAHVPDCTGQNAADARKLLEDAGFVCMMIYTASGDYPLDTVISQDIPADTSAAKGSRVWLTASTGSSSYVISTGGWSGNPLPSFNTESETESETEIPPEEELTDFFETAPDPIEPDLPEPEPEVIETMPPEIIPEFPETDPVIETAPPEQETPSEPEEYEEAPETAPF